MEKVRDGLFYEIGGKEYDGRERIKTTMFLEICRISRIAADMLIAYKTQENFRDGVDRVIDCIQPPEAASMFLAVQLKDVVCKLLEGWFQQNELGEETDEDSEGEDE